jgi:hypothetical protein
MSRIEGIDGRTVHKAVHKTGTGPDEGALTRS